MRLLTLVFIVVIALAGNSTRGAGPTTAQDGAAADYCTQKGGAVETRYPFYGTNEANPLRLAGSLQMCTFTAADGSRITVALDTLALCIFPDLSAIDSWGLTYHSEDIIRGADLAGLLRYQPDQPGVLFP